MRSPITRFTAKRPQSISGMTRSITARTLPSWLPRRPTLSEAVLGALAFMLEIHHCKRGQSYAYRMVTVMCGNGGGVHAAQVANPASPVVRRVRIERFAPVTGTRYADHVVLPRHRR